MAEIVFLSYSNVVFPISLHLLVFVVDCRVSVGILLIDIYEELNGCYVWEMDHVPVAE